MTFEEAAAGSQLAARSRLQAAALTQLHCRQRHRGQRAAPSRRTVPSASTAARAAPTSPSFLYSAAQSMWR